MNMASSKELSSDLVFEIISRTPSLQTLDICKTVCKEWEQLIDGADDFMPVYCQRTKNVSGYLIQGLKYSEHVSRFVSLDGGPTSSILPDHKNTRILASCRQGILCCLRGEGRENIYSVCKPTTGQSQDLPSPGGPTWETVSVAIMVLRSSPMRYKIVRLSTPNVEKKIGYSSFRCEIFDSEAWEWRDAGAIQLPSPELIVKSSPSVTTASNSVYWLTTHGNVVEFCEANESFNTFPLPETVRNNADNYGYKRLVEYQGRLGLVSVREDDRCSELWLKEPKIRNAWRKEMEVERVEEFAHPVGFYSPGIALFVATYEVMFYRVEDSSILRKVKMDWLVGWHELFPFRSDLEPVDLGRG